MAEGFLLILGCSIGTFHHLVMSGLGAWLSEISGCSSGEVTVGQFTVCTWQGEIRLFKTEMHGFSSKCSPDYSTSD